MGEAGSLGLGDQLAGLSPRLSTLFPDDVGQVTPLLAFFSLCIFFFKKLSKAPFRSHIHLFFNANWPSQTQQSMRWPVSHQIALVAIIWIGALETSPTPFSCQRRWKRHFWPQHWPLPWTWQCLSHYHFQLVLCPPAGPDFSERV